MAIKSLLYLHGFNSSPASAKATQALRYFAQTNRYRLTVPELPPEPRQAIVVANRLIEQEQISGIVGSSLGGYYGMFLHAKHNLPTVLINPAARPYELLSDYIGENTNMYTGQRYEVKSEHMQHLLELDVEPEAFNPSRLFLLSETDDEVLNYREAAVKLCGAKMYLTRGGDHSYQAFATHLPAIQRFFDRILSKS